MKLEIKHLAPYLPYRLKWTLQELNEFVMSGITSQTLYTESGTVLTWPKHPDLPIALFPLLRPLSDLTKEIEIDGKKFVPIVELAKIAYPDLVWEFDRTRAISEWKKEPAYFFFQKNSFFACLFNNAIPNQIVLFNKLFEWHFDVFGLIDKGLALPLI